MVRARFRYLLGNNFNIIHHKRRSCQHLARPFCICIAGELPLNTSNLAQEPKILARGFILLSAGNAEGIPVAQVHLLLTQPRSGLNSHLISTYLCNPFQGCVIVGASLSTGAPSALPAANVILPFPGKHPRIAPLQYFPAGKNPLLAVG